MVISNWDHATVPAIDPKVLDGIIQAAGGGNGNGSVCEKQERESYDSPLLLGHPERYSLLGLFCHKRHAESLVCLLTYQHQKI